MHQIDNWFLYAKHFICSQFLGSSFYFRVACSMRSNCKLCFASRGSWYFL